MRLDILLFERGFARSRTQARGAVTEGRVTVDGKTAAKPGQTVSPDADITVRPGHGYVSRGGVKLAYALDTFGINVDGLTAVDAGASSGGFTDCLLRRGALRVYAVDVGHGQLDETLRNDPRVVSMEGTDIRSVVLPAADMAVADVSFISLKLILPALKGIGTVVALVKPQFEAGPAHVGKGGIVKDAAVRHAAVESVKQCAEGLGFAVRGEVESPIQGGDGNKEYFIWLANG